MPPALYNSNSDDIVVEDINNTVRSNSVDSLSSTIDVMHHNKNSSARYQFSLIQDNDTNTTTSHFKLNLPTNQYKPTTKELAIQKVLSSIVILDSPTSPQVSSLLSKYNGKLLSIGTSILQGLYHAAPVNNDSSSGGFTGRARVGDYNENLFYHMELKDMNLIDIIQNNSTECSFSRPNDQQQHGGVHLTTAILQSEIKTFETTLRTTLNQQAISYRGSFMSTEQTMYQPAHVDYDYTILSKYGKRLYLAFFPLTLDGAYLQLWQKAEKTLTDDHEKTQRDEVEGTVVYIPYGQMLLLPSDTIHGGGFKRGKGGNLRFHLYIALDDEDSGKEDEGEGEKNKKDVINLLDHPMNKYTEEHDRRRELCERYVNAPGLDSLLGVFFDAGVSCNEDEDESPIPVVEEEPVVESAPRDDIEAVQKLANAVKGADLLGIKSLDTTNVGSFGTSKRNSASFVNLYGLTDEEIV